MSLNRSGQSLVEFALSLLPLVAALFAGSFVFHAEWNRLKCSRLVFDAAHDALTGKTTLSTRYEVSHSSNQVTASSQCGDARETVVLYTLESEQW